MFAFQFLNDKIHNYVKKNYFSLVLREREEKKPNILHLNTLPISRHKYRSSGSNSRSCSKLKLWGEAKACRNKKMLFLHKKSDTLLPLPSSTNTLE